MQLFKVDILSEATFLEQTMLSYLQPIDRKFHLVVGLSKFARCHNRWLDHAFVLEVIMFGLVCLIENRLLLNESFSHSNSETRCLKKA